MMYHLKSKLVMDFCHRQMVATEDQLVRRTRKQDIQRMSSSFCLISRSDAFQQPTHSAEHFVLSYMTVWIAKAETLSGFMLGNDTFV